MIGYLHGKVLDTDGKKALVLVQNAVGYEVNYSYYLETGSECSIFIHHHVSENDESLWGFNSLEDKKMFELLKTVNKIGSSKAYPLIANIGTAGILQAIMLDQANVLSQAPGIGKKMAEQIILSLKDKIDNFKATNLKGNNTVVEAKKLEPVISHKYDMTVAKDAILALDSLGYKDEEVSRLVKDQLSNGVTTSEEIIKNILREL